VEPPDLLEPFAEERIAAWFSHRRSVNGRNVGMYSMPEQGATAAGEDEEAGRKTGGAAVLSGRRSLRKELPPLRGAAVVDP